MTRREFLRGGTLAALSAAVGCRTCGDGETFAGGLRIGVQMWSVHELWKKDPVAAFRRLKEMGYDGVQSFGFYAMDWNELEKMLDGKGLRIVDMPFYMKNVQPGEFEKFVEFCQRFRIDFAYEPSSKPKTGVEWTRHAAELAALRPRFAAHGIRVGYHNHQRELKERYGGRTPLEILEAAGLDMELDVGHAKLAGADPVAWLNRLSGRVPSIHAKPAGGLAVGDADDRNDWPAILAAAGRAGAKWAIVECEVRRNTYEDVEKSIRFLRNGFAL